ncbi:alpha/beta fold hydrolase [Streptomyces sp. NPDC003247]|uniref:alpha/beta fold hydrolase n=1 Tax=Streptomyces sp. NPDC003247 TaxID=3364677 RepID=UPI0036C9D53B
MNQHPVLLPGLPGSGRSALPAGELRTDTVAEQVVETARVAGLRDFVIAGTSLGAAVAVTVAARRPDRVRGLFTLAGFARPVPRGGSGWSKGPRCAPAPTTG